MNVELLQKVKERILLYPENYEQSQWCGISCCIAGTAVLLEDPELYFHIVKITREGQSYDWEREVGFILNIAPDQARALFYLVNWPSPFQENFRAVRKIFNYNPCTLAEIVADRIQYFIETGD